MKKLCILFVLSFSFILSGCSDSNKQNYVKNIMFRMSDDKYIMTVEYYDFSGEDENYLTKEYSDEDIYRLGAIAVKDGNYNFRLMENCFVSADIFRDNINKIIYVINSLHIPVATDIVCYTGRRLPEDFSHDNMIQTYMYNLSFAENKVTGGFRITDTYGNNLGAVLVRNGQPVKVIDEKQWNILNMLCNNSERINYIFRNNEMLALLDNINSYYTFEDNILKIDITMSLKEYKGIQNSENSKRLFNDFLKSDIENTIYELYSDTAVDTVYNLHWLCNYKKAECTDIDVNINII